MSDDPQAIAADAHPRLPHGVRLVHNEAQGGLVLLAPERVFKPDAIAVAMSAGEISGTPFTSAGLSGSVGSAATRSHSTRSADCAWAGSECTASAAITKAQAIEIANDVNYGLTGYVWTGDMGRALRVADALEAGMIWLNSENVRHLPTPFGGMKASGIGRDGGYYSFDFYMETKHVSLARGTHKIQRLGVPSS